MSLSSRRFRRSTDLLPEQPTPPGVLWGAWMNGATVYGDGYDMAPWGMNTWDQFEANAGKKVSVLHYGQGAWWDEAFGAAMNDRIVGRGAYVCLDMACSASDLGSISGGTHDESLIAWAADVKKMG